MNSLPSLTVIIPALNEEENIEATVHCVENIVPKYFSDWEILIFDDGSTDRTGQIAETLASSSPKIKVIHHKAPKNLGYCYRDGVLKSSKEFIVMIPGDNECGAGVMEPLFAEVGACDIIIPYTANPEVRPLARRILSRAFVALINALSGCNLRYYNGTVLHKTSVIRQSGMQTDSFGYQAEALVSLIKRGYSYKEIPIEIIHRPKGKSKAFRLKNLWKVFLFFGELWNRSRQINPASKTQTNP